MFCWVNVTLPESGGIRRCITMSSLTPVISLGDGYSPGCLFRLEHVWTFQCNRFESLTFKMKVKDLWRFWWKLTDEHSRNMHRPTCAKTGDSSLFAVGPHNRTFHSGHNARTYCLPAYTLFRRNGVKRRNWQLPIQRGKNGKHKRLNLRYVGPRHLSGLVRLIGSNTSVFNCRPEPRLRARCREEGLYIRC